MRAAVLLILPLFLAAGCGGDDDLYEPPAELVDFEQSFELERLWSHSLGGSPEGLRLALLPATDGASIFAGSYEGDIVALSAQTGREVWSVETELPLSAGPGFAAGRLVFGSTEGDLLLLNSTTGEEIWRVDVGSEMLATPAINQRYVIVRTIDGRMRAYSIESGQQLWVAEQPVPPLTMRGDTPPYIAGQIVIGGFDNGRLAAYSLADGTPLWDQPIGSPAGTNELERLVDVAVDMRIAGTDIFTVSYRGRAARIDLQTGQGIWQYEVSSFAGLGVDLNTVYVSDEFGAIIALARVNGAEIWRQEALRLRDVTAGARLGAGLFVGDFEGYLHGLNPATGELIYRTRAAKSRISGAPLVVGQSMFIQSDGGALVAYALPSDDED